MDNHYNENKILTKKDFINFFKKTGIKKDMHVIVHIALKKFGFISTAPRLEYSTLKLTNGFEMKKFIPKGKSQGKL